MVKVIFLVFPIGPPAKAAPRLGHKNRGPGRGPIKEREVCGLKAVSKMENFGVVAKDTPSVSHF